MLSTSNDLAARTRDGLGLAVSEHRQVIADRLVDRGCETDVRLVDDHAGPAAPARRSLVCKERTESIRARILGLTKTADAWSSLCAVFRTQKRWSAVPPHERGSIIASLAKRRHIVETASLVANTEREVNGWRYAQMLELFLRWMGDAEAITLSYTMLGDYHARLKEPETGRHLHRRGDETCRKHLQAVELMWKWAWQRQARGDYVGIPQPDSLALKRQPPPHRLAPTWAHMDAMVQASNGWMRKLYLILRSTGLRVYSQAMQLRWDDIDLDNAVMRIRPELGKSRSERRGRWIPMAPWLAAELAGWGRRTWCKTDAWSPP